MNNFRCFISIIFISTVLAHTIYCQSISRSVIAFGGTEYNSENGNSLDATFGEMVIEHFRQDYVLTQGFQQGDILNLASPPTPEIDATVFPNPFEDVLMIDITLDADIKMRIYNVLGQLVYSTSPETEEMTIQTSDWHTGVYFVNFNAGGKTLFVEKVIKHTSK